MEHPCRIHFEYLHPLVQLQSEQDEYTSIFLVQDKKCWLFFFFLSPGMWGCLHIEITPQVLLGNTSWLILINLSLTMYGRFVIVKKKKKWAKFVKCSNLVIFNCRTGLCNFIIFWSDFTNFGETLWISVSINCYLVFRRLLNDTAFLCIVLHLADISSGIMRASSKI